MNSIPEQLGITEQRNEQLIAAVLSAREQSETMSDMLKSFGQTLFERELTSSEVELMYCAFHAGALHAHGIIQLMAAHEKS